MLEMSNMCSNYCWDQSPYGPSNRVFVADPVAPHVSSQVKSSQVW